MWVFKAENLKKEWNGKTIFENVDLAVHEEERVALIGANGVGKTTLFHCLTGKISPDDGAIDRRWPVSHWGIVEQQDVVPDETTMEEWFFSADLKRFSLKRELKRLEGALTSASHDLEALLQQYSDVQEAYQALGGYEWEEEVKGLLGRFGFSQDLWKCSYDQLSGGQKTRLKLARALVGAPSFLLLDEPTNHLDQETLSWFADWLKRFRGACLIVSHDRSFIDHVAHTTVELTQKGTRAVRGGYSDFLRERERERPGTGSALSKAAEGKEKVGGCHSSVP